MIYIIVSFIIDLLFNNFLPTAYQNINMLYPTFLIVSFPIAYSLMNNKILFFILVIVFGIIYDLLFSEIALINLYYFLLYGLFILSYYKTRKASFLNILLVSVFGLVFYDIFVFFTLILLNYQEQDIHNLYYKVKNSLFLNVIYIILSILILKSRIFGHKNKRTVF